MQVKSAPPGVRYDAVVHRSPDLDCVGAAYTLARAGLIPDPPRIGFVDPYRLDLGTAFGSPNGGRIFSYLLDVGGVYLPEEGFIDHHVDEPELARSSATALAYAEACRRVPELERDRWLRRIERYITAVDNAACPEDAEGKPARWLETVLLRAAVRLVDELASDDELAFRAGWDALVGTERLAALSRKSDRLEIDPDRPILDQVQPVIVRLAGIDPPLARRLGEQIGRALDQAWRRHDELERIYRETLEGQRQGSRLDEVPQGAYLALHGPWTHKQVKQHFERRESHGGPAVRFVEYRRHRERQIRIYSIKDALAHLVPAADLLRRRGFAVVAHSKGFALFTEDHRVGPALVELLQNPLTGGNL
jgi:hypothetical protein